MAVRARQVALMGLCALVGGVAAAGQAAAQERAARRVAVVAADGHSSTRWLAPGQWLSVSRWSASFRSVYRRGRELRFECRGPRCFVRIDGGPEALAAVLADTPEGLAALRQAIADGATGFVVSCGAAMLGKLPVLPRGRGLALVVHWPSRRL